jgi:mannose-6-phosphate isomerase-like protein (cupin superfamily)
MSDYTIKNFKDDIEDLAAARDPEGNVEARFGRSQIDSEHLGVSYFRYAPNFRAPFGHRHREQEEAYVVVSGSGSVRLDDEVKELRKWDLIRVAPQVARAFAAGADGLEVIAIGADRPDGGDGEMIPDFWTD